MRIKRFQKILREKNIDLAVILNWNNKDTNLFYFTGIDMDYSFLLIPKKGNSRLITSKLEFERAKKFSKIRDVRVFDKPAFEFISKFANKYGRRIGINKSVVSVKEFMHIKKYFKKKQYIEIKDILLQLRKKKDADEIQHIKKACRITDRIFSRLIGNFRFKTEEQIVDFLRDEAQKYGCTLSFEPIVASGRNSSMPHYRGGNLKLKKGFLTIDFGVNYKGYLSDMTRTIYLGKPTKKEEELYNILLDTQKKAIKLSKPGVKASKLTEFVKESLGKYKEYMIHGLGHGIGIQIHELPSLHSESKDILCEGDIFTIEPGIYFENKFGIRIEDDILIRNGRIEVLTRSPKELIKKRY